MQDEILVIKDVLNEFKIESFVFVENYSFSSAEEKQMMQQAMLDIDTCDFLIAETSEKGIGIGVEVGYAKAKNKPVVYLRNTNAEHSTTVAGISDYQVIYDNTIDLKSKLLLLMEIILEKILLI